MNNRLIRNGKIILDGTLPEREKEELAFRKLEKIEDFEEEFGIDDILILLRAFKEGVYLYDREGLFKPLVWNNYGFYIYSNMKLNEMNSPFYKFKDYGKTWSLTKSGFKR